MRHRRFGERVLAIQLFPGAPVRASAPAALAAVFGGCRFVFPLNY